MTVLTQEIADGVATLTLNRPDKLNALNEALISALLEHVQTLTAASMRGEYEVRAVVLTGQGEKAFAAGADIEAMRNMTPVQAKRFSDLGHRTLAALEHAPFPVIAAVNGFALGGGCELALACDFIFASDKAKFGQPEINLGVIPGFGGTQRLLRRVGAAMAREWCFTGEMVTADEAKRIGLVNRVVPAGELLETARGVARKIAEKSPLALRQCKRVLLLGEDVALANANELEAQAFAGLFGSQDQREGMAAFLERRKVTFVGH
jgi:enoyl-CoA hydratase